MEKKTIGDRAKAQIDKQTKKGLEKYGMLLDDNPAPVQECIEHLEEELADGLQYAIWIKDGIQEVKKEAYNQALKDIQELSVKQYPQSILFNRDITNLCNQLKKEA